MKKIAWLVLLLSLGLWFCGKAKKTEQAESTKSSPEAAVTATAPENRSLGGIKSVEFNADSLNSATSLIATPVFNDPGAEDVECQFRWFVNHQEIPEALGNVLDKRYFKKNDWVYCLVTTVSDGEASPPFRSAYIRIPNTPPELIPAPIAKFDVPGVFQYQVLASDLDQDELTYKIVAPLDLGIAIDAKTGLITWNVDKAMAERFRQPVKITYEVSDTDGATAYSAITVTFAPK